MKSTPVKGTADYLPSQTLLLRFTKGRPLTVQAQNHAQPQQLKKAS